MANRPPEITETENFEDPHALDRIVNNLGAAAIDWPFKTDCCGASQAIVVSCQMCQANLDMYQEQIQVEWGKRFSM